MAADKDDAAKAAGELPQEAVDEAKREILHGTGYRRPPEQTRFRKGQSGNPKGRPKRERGTGSPHTRDLVLREVRAENVLAIKGSNAYAQKHVIQTYVWAEREHRAEIAEDVRLWTNYVEVYRAAIAAAERKGEAPPSPLPHPDDIVINYETGVRFIGPTDKDGLKRVHETCRLRDVLLMQDALDRRLADDLDGDDKPGTALLWATILNQGVPARFRLSDIDIVFRMERHQGTPKRQLLKEVRLAWQGLGRRPPPRGWTFPPLAAGQEIAEACYEAACEALDGADVDEIARSLAAGVGKSFSRAKKATR